MPQNLGAVVKGIAFSLLLMLGFLFIATACLVFSSISEQFIRSIMPFVRFICIFSGAFVAAKEIGHQGLWLGLIVALSFLLLFFSLFVILDLDKLALITIALEFIISGILGGIAGIIAN